MHSTDKAHSTSFRFERDKIMKTMKLIKWSWAPYTFHITWLKWANWTWMITFRLQLLIHFLHLPIVFVYLECYSSLICRVVTQFTYFSHLQVIFPRYFATRCHRSFVNPPPLFVAKSYASILSLHIRICGKVMKKRENPTSNNLLYQKENIVWHSSVLL